MELSGHVRIENMKIGLIFIIIFFLVIPYTVNKDTFQINTAVMSKSQHNAPCPQKSSNNARMQCNSNITCIASVLFNIHSNLQLQLGLITFIYLVVLCLGFKTPIYKPPKLSLQA